MDEMQKKCPERSDKAESRGELLEALALCLKEARQSRELSLEEAAMALKLRMVYLEALESGDWSEMPGEVYALGFLKQYAAHLGVDVSDSVEKLKTGDYKLTKPLTFPDPPIAPNRTWVIIAALAFIVLFILFNIFDGGEPEQPVEPAPQQAMQFSEMRLAPEIDTPVQEQEAAEPSAVEAPLVPETKTVPGTAQETPSAPLHEYRLSAAGGDVWLQVSTDPGEDEYAELIQEALLKDGESIVIRNPAASLQLTCGNAAALQIDVDGHTMAVAGSLGDEGKVLRDFRLTAE